jgi:lipopolysaccharide export system permease protein
VLIPPLQEKIGRDSKDLMGDKAHDLHPKYDLKSEILISGRQTLGAEQRIIDPRFMMPPQLEDWGHQITAESAYYQSAEGERPAGYLLRGVRQPADVALRESLTLADERIVLSPLDADWLKPDECFVVSEIDFEQLTGGQRWKQLSSTADLVRGLSNPSLDFGADVRVAIHGRFVKPGLDMTLLLLGLPLVVARESRNIFLSIGMCVVVVSVFMMVVLACQFLGTSYLISPALAAWLPLIIFVPVAVGMFEQMRK